MGSNPISRTHFSYFFLFLHIGDRFSLKTTKSSLPLTFIIEKQSFSYLYYGIFRIQHQHLILQLILFHKYEVPRQMISSSFNKNYVFQGEKHIFPLWLKEVRDLRNNSEEDEEIKCKYKVSI
jgi:hypothetical protein